MTMFSGCTWASTCMRRHPPIISGARPGGRQDAGYVRDRATGTWGTFCWTATGWPSVCARVRLRQRHTHFEREGKKCRRTRHVRQNVCPHPIVTGSASMLRQTAHSSRLGSTERGEADGAGAHAAVPAWVPMGGCGGGCAAMNRTPTQAVDAGRHQKNSAAPPVGPPCTGAHAHSRWGNFRARVDAREAKLPRSLCASMSTDARRRARVKFYFPTPPTAAHAQIAT
jgi:hypothetical protein